MTGVSEAFVRKKQVVMLRDPTARSRGHNEVAMAHLKALRRSAYHFPDRQDPDNNSPLTTTAAPVEPRYDLRVLVQEERD